MSVPMYQLPEQLPSVWQPTSVEEAIQLKHKWGSDAVIVAGGTWLRTRWENGLAPMPQHFISLGRILALSGLTVNAQGKVHIGPGLSIADLMKNELVQQKCALLVQACSEIAAPSIRNLASIGGNVMTRTGDLIPALLVMDAQIQGTDGQNERIMALKDWLAAPLGAEDEIMTNIIVQTEIVKEAGILHEFYLKVGRREAFTPSVVTVAGRISLLADGTIADIALAVGGGNAIPARLSALEAEMRGKPLSKAGLQHLHKGVMADFNAVTDDYAGVAYRKQTAANLIVSECYKAWRKGGGAYASQS
ncbi:FAD binding domain-containing protein [Paenibacillus qinlingensis]|uniref:Carbon-monoxide dehydrogenase medium subunit n=1 Tax=Paenibacillus qinlingensis TaxID=1837343 RepID=A0ABU1P4X8_9BACL|nr:FAD binding domain-containing protein [Paenibacillus qinlingensis]MDR6554614.1 carbon-monoxide dehydrogenase medium subunit [Paenibacillus qinlingensis]